MRWEDVYMHVMLLTLVKEGHINVATMPINNKEAWVTAITRFRLYVAIKHAVKLIVP